MKNLKLFLGLLAGAGVYCYLMWYQELGLNTIVFSILLITSIFLFKKELRKNRMIWCLAGAFFLSTVSVAVNGINYSKCIYYLSMLVFLSFVQIPQLRSLLYAAPSFIVNFFIGIKWNWNMTIGVFSDLFQKKKTARKMRNIYVYIGRGLIVFILVSVFFLIFVSANPQFRKFCQQIITPIEDFLQYLFEQVQFWDIIHYGFIFYFLSLFFIRFKDNVASNGDAACDDNIRRKRIRIYDNFLTVGLKDECKTAILSISLINILLLGVNISDIFSVWLGIVPESANDLSDFVHKGTYALIFSTLLSIFISLFYFRKNLNLYFGNKRLKQISYIWIIQNAFLLCSVGLRNIHYIGQCGLTYKRIGVFIFLIITGLALFFLYQKISKRKSLFYYFRVCGWGFFCTMLFSGLINWDVLIAHYNTSNKAIETDYEYLGGYYLSEQALMFLPSDKLEDRRYRIKNYIENTEKRDWQSFSLWDYWAVQKLRIEYNKMPEEIDKVVSEKPATYIDEND